MTRVTNTTITPRNDPFLRRELHIRCRELHIRFRMVTLFTPAPAAETKSHVSIPRVSVVSLS
jgi:hypothetical protein